MTNHYALNSMLQKLNREVVFLFEYLNKNEDWIDY